MTIPAYKDVDLALLLELVRRGGTPARPVDIYLDVARHFPHLTQDDLALTRTDGRTKVFYNMVAWSRDHIKRRGLLVDATGLWAAVPGAGSALIEDLVSRGAKSGQRVNDFVNGTEAIPNLLGDGWARSVRAKAAKSTTPAPQPAQPAAASPVAVAAPTLVPVRAVAPAPQTDSNDRDGVKAALLARLNQMAGYEFEQLVAKLLDTLGFRDTQVVGKSGDEGVDLITYLDSPLIRAKVAVQVKRHSANVGPKDISYLRDRWGHRADRLLFVTTAAYTAGAQEVAVGQGDKPVELVNGDQLIDVMIEHGLGVSTRPVVKYELDENFFSGV